MTRDLLELSITHTKMGDTLFAAGRLEIAAATDTEALDAMSWVARAEGILPALETAHAFAVLPRLIAGNEGSGAAWPDETLVLLGLSGRGDKDLSIFGKHVTTADR